MAERRGGGNRNRSRSRSPFGRKNSERDGIQDRLKRISGTDGDQPTENGISDNVKIDREKTCPLLLRVFCQIGKHHRTEEFAHNKTPSNELQIYTWKDASLKELMSLVKEVNPEARRKGTYFDFAIIYPNFQRGGYILKDIGTTCSGQKCPDDNVTLHSKRFQIGDFLDIAIMLPPKERRDSL
ncbi:histone deacetylase complex subunit SAP18-like [Hydractinia symbiolongicarpus]|uniref:histone deacetylase complex subunit SAP18-like n=1 Tax=Hydractinia symbiolongicarpus TaxID=13093 RepID=UPI002549EBA2|nr:histone deacetylase complex subunit SAP18-like [Hydractinia symbiolongicarpus]